MFAKGFCGWRSGVVLGWLLMVSVPGVYAAPGDLKLEIIAADGDDFGNANSVILKDFEYTV